MPYTFRFSGPANLAYSCPLQCTQCSATSQSTGQRCRMRTCIGTPLCWQHLLSQKKVRIMPSAVAGKGLFAKSKTHAANAVLFSPGDVIVEYGGERITRAQLEARYGDYTAPYGLSDDRQRNIEDGACKRGPGTLANHAPNANAKYSMSRPKGRTPFFRLVATAEIRNGQEIFCSYGDNYLFDEPTQHTTSTR